MNIANSIYKGTSEQKSSSSDHSPEFTRDFCCTHLFVDREDDLLAFLSRSFLLPPTTSEHPLLTLQIVFAFDIDVVLYAVRDCDCDETHGGQMAWPSCVYRDFLYLLYSMMAAV